MKRYTLQLSLVSKKLLPASGSLGETQSDITMHHPTPSGGRERGVKCERVPNYLVGLRGSYLTSA